MKKLTIPTRPSELLRSLMKPLRLTPAKIARAIPLHPVFSRSDFAKQIREVLVDDEESLMDMTLGLALDRYFGLRPGHFWHIQAEHDVRDEQHKTRVWLAHVRPLKTIIRTRNKARRPVDIYIASWVGEYGTTTRPRRKRKSSRAPSTTAT